MIGDTSASFQAYSLQATKFMLNCYGYEKYFVMAAATQNAWKTKVGNAIFDLSTVPPIDIKLFRTFPTAHL